jgi:hypothetical protein
MAAHLSTITLIAHFSTGPLDSDGKHQHYNPRVFASVGFQLRSNVRPFALIADMLQMSRRFSLSFRIAEAALLP